MDSVFLRILNMSLMASFAIVVVLLARLLLHKAPKVFSYALWAVVLFRLLCPFSFESSLSLIPIKPQLENYALADAITESVSLRDAVAAALGAIGDAANGGIGSVTVYYGQTDDGYPVTTEAYHSQVWMLLGKYIWIVGVLALNLYSFVSLWRLQRRLVGSVKLRDNIYLADRIVSPFVLRLLRPKIYLPSALSDQERTFIILHEQTHIKRCDHMAKIIAFAALTLHWFNPLVWLAFACATKDMEMACDEAVLKRMGTDIRREYSTSLLRLATGRNTIAATPLAFGEGDTKGRVKNIMRFKKPTGLGVAAAVLVVMVLVAGLAVNPSRLSANELEEKARRSKSVGEDWDVAMDVSHGIGALLFYNVDHSDSRFSIYIDNGTFFEDYQFRRGGSSSIVDYGVEKFEHDDAFVILSMNFMQAERIETVDGETMYLDPEEPFIKVFSAADEIRLYGMNGEEIPVPYVHFP